MNTKTRLTDLAGRLSKNRKSSISEKRRIGKRTTTKALHPPHGQKGGFIKVTATLAPETYELIMQEVVRRRMQKDKTVIREAIAAYLPCRE